MTWRLVLWGKKQTLVQIGEDKQKKPRSFGGHCQQNGFAVCRLPFAADVSCCQLSKLREEHWHAGYNYWQ